MSRDGENQTERIQVRDETLELGSHNLPHDIYTLK